MTPAQRERLLDLWAAGGNSYAQIAAAVGVSQGAVAGVLKRARAAGDARARVQGTPVGRPKAPRPAPAPRPAAQKPAQKAAPSKVRSGGSIPNAKALLAAVPTLGVPSRCGGCAWPMHWGREAPPDEALWCGQPVKRGLWCEGHAAIGYARAPAPERIPEDTMQEAA